MLDDLRIIILNERESGRLSEVPPTLYDGIRGHLASIQEKVYSCSDPLSDDAQTLIEEVKAMREIVRDIFRIRSRKILSLALVQVEAEATERDELKKMLPAEREMFDGIVRELDKGKAALSGQVPRAAPGGGSGSRREPRYRRDSRARPSSRRSHGPRADHLGHGALHGGERADLPPEGRGRGHPAREERGGPHRPQHSLKYHPRKIIMILGRARKEEAIS